MNHHIWYNNEARPGPLAQSHQNTISLFSYLVKFYTSAAAAGSYPDQLVNPRARQLTTKLDVFVGVKNHRRLFLWANFLIVELFEKKSPAISRIVLGRTQLFVLVATKTSSSAVTIKHLRFCVLLCD